MWSYYLVDNLHHTNPIYIISLNLHHPLQYSRQTKSNQYLLIDQVIYVYSVSITDPSCLPVHNSPAAIMFTIAVFSREDTALVNIRRHLVLLISIYRILFDCILIWSTEIDKYLKEFSGFSQNSYLTVVQLG